MSLCFSLTTMISASVSVSAYGLERASSLIIPKPVASYNQPESVGGFESFTIGFPDSGSLQLTQRKRPTNQQAGVGFLKIFLTTGPVDLSNLPQVPPYTEVKHWHELEELPCKTTRLSCQLETILIPVVQRRTVV